MWILLAFIAVPLIEIALFIQVGGAIGLWPTLGIVILTAFLGTIMIRGQGIAAIGRLQSSFTNLQDPTEPLAHGAMILFAGALLLTPGFFTDAFGVALLIPQIRSLVFQYAKSRIGITTFASGQTPQDTNKYTDPETIDGEYTDVSNADEPSKWTKH